MAMNRARRTSNLNNILTYDTLGNSTLIANLTVEGLTGAGFVKADAAGLLSVDTAAYTVVTGATNYLTKITGASTLGQSLVYDNGTSVLVNSTVGVPGYGHAFQVVANPSGGLVVSTTDVASAIGIVNSASANKTWDISPYGNHLVINESGIATRMKFDAGGNITIGDIVNTGHKLEIVGSFRTTGTNTLSQLQGVGDRMVVADTNGILTTQPIPTGSITGSGAAGQVNFWTGTNTVSGSNNLFWDNANTALAIGGTTIDSNIALQVNSAKGIRISGTGGGFGYTIVRGIETSGLSNTGSSTVISSTNTLAFYTNGSEAFRVASNRNISIGTISDLGTRLGVVGDTLLRGSGNTNSTLVLTAQNSDSANVLRVFNGGSIGIGNAADRPLILPFTTSAGSPTLTGTNLSFFSGTGTQAATQGIFAFENIAAAQTSGNNYFIRALGNYRPTSGTGTYAHIRIEGIINQTGGANGITRGIWIDPTLTAAADWRSIEWSNNTGWGLYGAGTANNLLNGRLYIPAGSYDLPSLSFVNDTNTGLFSPLADNIELKTGTNNAVVLENQGVNLKTYSEVLASGGTNYQNISVSIPGNVVAPDGTTTANIAIPDATLAQHRFYHTVTVSEPYTTSIYAKSAGYNFISIGFAGGVNGGGIIFDIINGTVLGTAAGFIGQIENVGNGWFRCSLIRTSTAAATALSRFIIVRNANSTADYSGDGISGVYLWGYQIEENTASTSYTKTGATSVARPQATTILGQNLYGNLITRRVTGPSLTDLSFATGFTDRMTIHATSGNVMINSSNDLGQRLQVIGDVFIRGTGNTNTTNALAVQNSDSVNIFRVRNDATLSIGSFSENPLIYSSDFTGGVSANGASLTFNVQNGTSGSGRYIFTGAAKSSTAVSGNQNLVVYIQSFAPTSGGVSYNLLDVQPTINQTGGANGITRGIYINPVLTAAADFRAIEVSSGITVLAPSTTTSASLRLPNGVAPTTPTNGDVWSTTTDLLARIGGTTYSLINSGLSGSGAAGQVTYWSSASGLTGSNNLFWDDVNGRLGIGTNVPTNELEILSATPDIYLVTTGSSTYNARIYARFDGANSAGFAGRNGNIVREAGTKVFLGQSDKFVIDNNSNLYPRVGINVSSPLHTLEIQIPTLVQDGIVVRNQSTTEIFRLTNGGNLILNSTTDAGQRLQVYGDTLLRGSGNTNTTTALTVQNSDGNGLLTIANDGILNFGNLQAGGNRYRFAPNLISYTNGVSAQALTFTAGPITFNASVIGVKTSVTGATYHNILVGGDWALNFSTDSSSIRASTSFSPTSSNARYSILLADATINQTGGANGITRGLYVNPTLTSAADFRAIETTVGKVIFAGAGNVMVGSATDDTVNKLQVTGTIVAGSATSTNGSVILRGSYTNGYLTTVGTDASSGGPMLSYGVESAQNSTAGAFVSSSGITIPRSAYVQNGGHVWYTAASSTTAIGTAITMTKHMELYNSGNLVLGGGADDAVNRLQVSGGTSIAGRVIISSTTEHQLEVANPSGGRLLVFVSATANSFSFRDSQGYGIHHSTGYSGFNARQSNIRLWTQAADTILLNLGGQDVNPTVARTRTIIEPVGSATTAFSPTSGTAVDYLFRAQSFIAFQPTSGNATYTQMQLSPTINQTGGANGVTRGFHVNPTLTAAADWRSIEWSNNTGWGLYGVGTAKNYLNGTTLIGTTTDDGINKLQVAGSISSAGIMRADASRTAAINDVSIALLGSNITTYAAGFSMSAGGYGLNAIYAQHEQRFGGNATFDGGNLTGGGLILNKLAPTAAGTVTMTQQNSGLRVRTMSNLHLMTQFSGNNNLTVTHMSGMHIYGHYRTSGTGTLTVSTAYYGVFLADPNEFGTGATVTGSNYGFYQQGAAPFNHFGGKVIIGTTATDGTSKLRISGLPTSSAGLLTGEVWNNGGVLTIV